MAVRNPLLFEKILATPRRTAKMLQRENPRRCAHSVLVTCYKGISEREGSGHALGDISTVVCSRISRKRINDGSGRYIERAKLLQIANLCRIRNPTTAFGGSTREGTHGGKSPPHPPTPNTKFSLVSHRGE